MNEIPVLELNAAFIIEKFDEIYERLEGGIVVLMEYNGKKVFVIGQSVLKDLLDGTQFSIEP